MRYLSICSGIEAATVAWHGLGWEPIGFSEIEPFPCQLLAKRFPTVPNLGDMTKYREWPVERGTVDLLVGGTPCQAFSVAGLRKGLEDPRGNLALTFVGMVDWYRPEWVVWENVPGVLSSSGGRDFGAFLGALGQLGYGWSYRVLDAQYFGVPQRRRRVFVVAHSSGDSRRAGAVLFEPESLRGDTKARKRTGQDAPAHAGASFEAGYGSVLYENHANDSRVTQEDSTCPTVSAFWGTGGNNTPLVQQPMAFSPQGGGDMRGVHPRPTAQLQRCQIKGVIQPIGLDEEQNAMVDGFGCLKARTEGGGFEGAVMTQQMAVRRLTPVECERLQGFQDGWTDIRPKGKDTPDSPRYKALGNSMAVPVMRWIGERIATVIA